MRPGEARVRVRICRAIFYTGGSAESEWTDYVVEWPRQLRDNHGVSRTCREESESIGGTVQTCVGQRPILHLCTLTLSQARQGETRTRGNERDGQASLRLAVLRRDYISRLIRSLRRPTIAIPHHARSDPFVLFSEVLARDRQASVFDSLSFRLSVPPTTSTSEAREIAAHFALR
jgi:hypothetical protein